ncbi:MAG: magnesium-translocating P-type ATPase [Proteobacteria bacterium]|nr:magnesium-translocating P-type ATPase [Pseudomonadota bacterium]
MFKTLRSLFFKQAAVAHEDIVAKLRTISAQTPDKALETLQTSEAGLTHHEVSKRLTIYGQNMVESKATPLYVQALHCIFSHFNLILFLLAFISWLTDDMRATILMVTMAFLSAIIRFYQELRSGQAAAKLKQLVQNTSRVRRLNHQGSKEEDVPIQQIVPGDIVVLSAGDMVPADLRIIASRDLYINQSMLTGEALPVEKNVNNAKPETALLEQQNLCFMGSNVVSGSAQGVILATGQGSYLGALATEISRAPAPSSFDKGVYGVSMILIKTIFLVGVLVFIINALNTESWIEALMFAIAVAVGLTPEMLPMVVSANLAKGAVLMARSKVVVKHLSAINNFGSMDILCTDKTGTLTMDKIVLQHHLNLHYKEDQDVLKYAYLNSYNQTGLRNLLDSAILEHVQHDHIEDDMEVDKFAKIDELPFDFARRRMSVVVEDKKGTRMLICKGAVEEVSELCTHYEKDGKLYTLTPSVLKKLSKQAHGLNENGFKVLLLTYRHLDKNSHYSVKDEKDLTIKGLLAFLDPPKESAYQAIPALISHGVEIKVITGDNAEVTRYVCKQVGLEIKSVLLGEEIERMSDEELLEKAPEVTIFAKISPIQKAKIIKTLRSCNYTVGFMGDGVNDALALHEADVGISVDTGVDIAKESADIILLEKSLSVLERGIIEGRITFMNVMKYIKMTLSSNFGNVFSIIGGSALFPFLPMMPAQLLLQNFLYDISQTTIPFDKVDPDSIEKPKQWSQKDILRFMVCMGPISSIFDYLTFAMLWFYFGGNTIDTQDIFQTGWFMSGLLTQTLIVHMIRTSKIPFLESTAAPIILFSTVLIATIGLTLPYTHLANYAQFTPLPMSYFLFLACVAVGYWVVTSMVKKIYIKKFNTW